LLRIRRVLTLRDINRALDELGVGAFVPRTRRGRSAVTIVMVNEPRPEPRDAVIELVPVLEDAAG
jgi:hypothetical protein